MKDSNKIKGTKKATKSKLISKKNKVSKLSEKEKKLKKSSIQKQTPISKLQWSIKDSFSKIGNTYIVVVTCKGHIYADTVPTQIDFISYRDFLATIADNISIGENTFKVEGTIKVTDIPEINAQMITAIYKGDRYVNAYGDVFDKILGMSTLIGGNIIFSGVNAGLNKEEATKVINWIINKLQNSEQIISFDK